MSWIVWLLGIFILLGGFLNIGNLFFNYYSDDDESILKEKINFEDLADYHLTLGISLSFLGAWMAGYLQFLSYILLFLALYISYRSISIEKIKGSIEKIKVSKEKEVLTIEGSNEDTEKEWAGFTEKVEKLTDLLAELGQRTIDFASSTFNDSSNLKKRGFFLSSVALSLLIVMINIGNSSSSSSSSSSNNKSSSSTYKTGYDSSGCPTINGERMQGSPSSIANTIFSRELSGKTKSQQRQLANSPLQRCTRCFMDIYRETQRYDAVAAAKSVDKLVGKNSYCRRNFNIYTD